MKDKLACLLCLRTQREDGHRHTKGRALAKHQTCQSPDLGFPVSRAVGNASWWSHPVRGARTAAPTKKTPLRTLGRHWGRQCPWGVTFCRDRTSDRCMCYTIACALAVEEQGHTRAGGAAAKGGRGGAWGESERPPRPREPSRAAGKGPQQAAAEERRGSEAARREGEAWGATWKQTTLRHASTVRAFILSSREMERNSSVLRRDRTWNNFAFFWWSRGNG